MSALKLRAHAGLRTAVAALAPGHRRWLRFLRSLPLDPDRLPRPLAPLDERDFVICGCPRTGTTLLTAVLFQPPKVVTVMEPWDGMRMAPATLFRSLRDELDAERRLGRGRLDLDALESTGAVRWCPEGQSARQVDLDAHYLLGVKWPGYWRFLPDLPDTRFLVCVRDPVGTIRSFRDAGGRLRQGLQYQTVFNARLNQHLERATSDPAVRRVLLYDYVHERVLPYLRQPNVFAVRYERWFDDPAGLLSDLSAFLEVELGPGPATIRRHTDREPLPESELRLIREQCRTAADLGYAVHEGSVADG